MRIKVFMTLLSLLLNFDIFAQDTVQTQTAVLTLPKGTMALPKETIKTYAESHFKGAHYSLPCDRTYIKDGLLITIREREAPKSIRTLENLKSILEGVDKETGSSNSKFDIITINNNRFLIIQDYNVDRQKLYFYTDYVNHKSSMGTVEYDNKDTEKAKQILNDLLQKIKFKR